ncbi:hypothetical protein F511_15780 [Dorcoceras hygrometricum]|nr:hypothetical protein F511_15780 [Dorcoceras hygrometricum]
MGAGLAWWPAVASNRAQIVARWCAVCAPCLAHGVAGDAALGAAACGHAPHAMLAAAVRRISDSDATAIFLLGFVRAYPGQPMKYSGQYSILGRFWSDQN